MDKTKIYGITFDETAPRGGEKRVFDAAGLSNDYVVGNTFMVGGGQNDFDSAYPFGAMRLCCVSFVGGVRRVIYEGEPGFSRSGSAGNVMVEVPLFYVRREKEDHVETWCVSGTEHPGFVPDPVFCADGKILEKIYIGAYNNGSHIDGREGKIKLAVLGDKKEEKPALSGKRAGESADGQLNAPPEEQIALLTQKEKEALKASSDATLAAAAALPDGVFSFSGVEPEVNKTIAEYESEAFAAGFTPYDFTVFQCLQRLMVIEFGTRYLKEKLGGLSYFSYFSRLNKSNPIVETGKNRVTVTARPRMLLLAPGHEIGFGHVERDLSLHRTVKKVTRRADDPSLCDIEYEGEDLGDVIKPGEDACYGIPQKLGLTDTLPYHTGRTAFSGSLYKERDYLINAFKYRGIENIWGNVWETLSGLRIRDLQYFYTTEPSEYSLPFEKWKKTPFLAPLQHYLASDANPLWVARLGFDPASPALLFPEYLQKDAAMGSYYDSAFYSYKDRNYADKPVSPDREYIFAVGGGHDHSEYGSLFTYRGFLAPQSFHWLYGERICLRK